LLSQDVKISEGVFERKTAEKDAVRTVFPVYADGNCFFRSCSQWHQEKNFKFGVFRV